MIINMFEKKLIAKFMYENLYDEDGVDSCVLDEGGGFRFYIEYLEYDSSWDKLIPVIKKCIKYNIYASDWGNHLHDGLLFCNLEQCYESVVEFLKSLNND